MGADLIVYTAHVPVKKYSSIIKKRLSEVGRVLLMAGDTTGTLEECNRRKFKAYDSIGFGVRDFCESYYSIEGLSPSEQISEISAEMSKAIESAFQFSTDGFRDTSSWTVRINGQVVRIMVAGELSWGDEPEGEGYQTLKRLAMLGILDRFDKAIKWDARSKR